MASGTTMAASPKLMAYLRQLGLTDQQIQSLIASAGGTDGTLNEGTVAAAAARYAAALANGSLASGTTPGTTQPPSGAPPVTGTPSPGGGPSLPATPPGMMPTAEQGPFTFDPAWGVPSGYVPTAQGVQDYYGQVATGMLSGAYTPYQWAAASRGQNPANMPPSLHQNQDASPEARLPGQAYAGTQLASALTPEQAASIRYNTPEFQAFIAAAPHGANEFTANNLFNARQSGSYAGDPTDLDMAGLAAHQEQFKRVQQANPMITWDQYVRSLAPQHRDQIERITGAPTTTGNVASQNPNYQAPIAPYYQQGSASQAAQPGSVLDMTSQSGYTTPPMTQDASGNWQLPPGATTGSAVVAPPGGLPPPVDYSAAIAKNQKYVANILAVPEAQRTPQQKASLTAAQRKITDYSTRS